MDHDNDDPTASRSIDRDAPLRLKDAISVAFPMGGITEAGLRTEARRGRLKVELIAGRYFTTLAAIDEMRRLCRVEAKPPASPDTSPAREVDNDRILPQEALMVKLEGLRKGHR
jgi:hypothetical protein